MKRILILILVLSVLTPALQAGAAGQIKLKYVGSIYTDAAGAALNHPAGVTVTKDLLLVADSGGKRVLSYRYQQGEVKPDQVYPLPEMFPLMVEPAGNGQLYVLDGRAKAIFVLDANGKVKGKYPAKGLPDTSRIIPRSIRSGSDGTLLVLDIFSARVLIFAGDGQFLRQLPFPALAGAIADLCMDRQGNIYLLDSVQAALWVARSGTDQFAPLTVGMKENMNFPTSLATDNLGNLLLVDKHGSGLAIVGTDGAFAGRRLSMGWSDSNLYYPSQISISDSGDLFIADTANNRIQHFNISE
ncbi:NHL repeat-containing protein [Pelobacter seleniigenes]|uniref:NHL repeat-containing protein n=1 Tax=Pelobacter seleniigenes TaxID=407188 RepID=UPI0004A6E89C|nr:NHL repeat-containing protein [Pelobacter seleniigenes]